MVPGGVRRRAEARNVGYYERITSELLPVRVHPVREVLRRGGPSEPAIDIASIVGGLQHHDLSALAPR